MGVCQYCGKEISKAGIMNHEKACSENPANKPQEEAQAEVVTEETVEVREQEAVEQPKEAVHEDLVTIKVKTAINCYIGDRYFRFSAGEVTQVPQSVKERLMGAGLLEAI